MKSFRNGVLAAAVLATMAVSTAAMADRGGRGGHGGWRGHGGWHGGYGVGALIGGTIIAGALLSPWAYSSPYYYSSYPVVEYVPAAPTVYYEQPRAYIEQPRAVQPAAADAGSWYYCNESRAYYPYVKECASPWQRVAPTPAPR